MQVVGALLQMQTPFQVRCLSYRKAETILPVTMIILPGSDLGTG